MAKQNSASKDDTLDPVLKLTRYLLIAVIPRFVPAVAYVIAARKMLESIRPENMHELTAAHV